jgi:hypothetical protein
VILNPEKWKVGGSTPPLTTVLPREDQPSYLREPQEERDSHGAGSAPEIQDQHKNNTTGP